MVGKRTGITKKCTMCGQEIPSRAGAYLWVGFGYRGTVPEDMKKTEYLILCPICGSVFKHEVKAMLVATSRT